MERFAPRYDPRALTFLQMATACVGFTAIASRAASSRCRTGATVWGALLVTGVFAGALGYLIATWVQARTTAARAALVFTLEAPFAALFGVLLADEVLGWAGLARLRGDDVPGSSSPSLPPRTRFAGSRAARVGQRDAGRFSRASSAFLFGAMTVLVRIALDTGVAPPAGALLTILPACDRHRARGGGPRRVGPRERLALRPRGPARARASRRSSSRSPYATRARRARPSRSGRLRSSRSRRRSSSSTSRSWRGSSLGAALIVTGGILLASDRASARALQARSGSSTRSSARSRSRPRDTLVRWLVDGRDRRRARRSRPSRRC